MAGRSVGIRELKAHLSRYLKEVREGRSVLVPNHGWPIGRIVSTTESLGPRLNDAQRDALYCAIKSTLRQGIRWGRSTIRDYRIPDGESGRFQERFRVYARAGLPCKRRCGGRIEKLSAAKDAHPGFYCPRCQALG